MNRPKIVLGHNILPDFGGGLGQVGKHVLQAGEADLEGGEFFSEGSGGMVALREESLSERVINEEVEDVGTSMC